MDARLFGGRLDISVDAYLKQTDDLLLDVIVPYTSGFSTALRNVGSTQNRGIDLAVDGNVATGTFRWWADGNLSINRYKVLSLGEIDEFFTGGFTDRFKLSDPLLIRVGEPVGGFFGYVNDGIFRDQEAVKKTGNQIRIEAPARRRTD